MTFMIRGIATVMTVNQAHGFVHPDCRGCSALPVLAAVVHGVGGSEWIRLNSGPLS
jgi:hypothetical protein